MADETKTPVEVAAEALTRVHWDGTGCGTHGTSACTNCFGPSPMTEHEIVRDVFASVDVDGLAAEIGRHWLLEPSGTYGGAQPVERSCNCGRTLAPQYFEWRHSQEMTQHEAEAVKAWLTKEGA